MLAIVHPHEARTPHHARHTPHFLPSISRITHPTPHEAYTTLPTFHIFIFFRLGHVRVDPERMIAQRHLDTADDSAATFPVALAYDDGHTRGVDEIVGHLDLEVHLRN